MDRGLRAQLSPHEETALRRIAAGSTSSSARPAKDNLTDADRAPIRSGVEVRQAAAPFARPIKGKALLQLLTSFGPFIAACVSMYLVYPLSPVISVVLALPVGVLLVRVFIIQHDCGHNSFFASPRANLLVGLTCSLLTLTPFVCWARQHSLHHGSWSNLDRRKGADLYSACLTVREFFALSRWRRLLHRLPRHPLIANVLLPPLIFLLLYRLPFDTPRRWVRERRSVHVTNVALLAVFGALALVFGWQEVLIIHVSIMVVASIVGVWLFSLQHRFETARWTRRKTWDPSTASMEGSSWLRLPHLLNWLTGNIGFHHVHHLNSRVPNYNLEAAHDAVQEIWAVAPLSFRGGLDAPWLALWDEKTERLISFRNAKRAAA